MPENITALTSRCGLTLNYLADDAARPSDLIHVACAGSSLAPVLRDNVMKE
jgi:hypothetical protein